MMAEPRQINLTWRRGGDLVRLALAGLAHHKLLIPPVEFFTSVGIL